ncbi:MAG: hypothetical protein RIC55_31180 [Pirellulaceae bacterium]
MSPSVWVGENNRVRFSIRALLVLMLVAGVLLTIVRFRRVDTARVSSRIVVRKEQFGQAANHRRIAIEVWSRAGSHETYRDYEPFGTLDEVLVVSSEGDVVQYVSQEHPWLRVNPPRPLDGGMREDFRRLKEIVDREVEMDVLQWYDYLDEAASSKFRPELHVAEIELSQDFELSRKAKQ